MSDTQGQNLYAYLRYKKINLSELAQKLNVARSTLYDWFKLEIVPYEYHQQLSQITGWTPIGSVFEVKESEMVYNASAVQALQTCQLQLESLREVIKAKDELIAILREQIKLVKS